MRFSSSTLLAAIFLAVAAVSSFPSGPLTRNFSGAQAFSSPGGGVPVAPLGAALDSDDGDGLGEGAGDGAGDGAGEGAGLGAGDGEGEGDGAGVVIANPCS
jgi:hypothetical protein